MSDLLVNLIVVYLSLAAFAACLAYLAFDKGYPTRVRRNGARCLLLAPVWPVLAVWGIVYGVRHVWAAAEWRTK